VISSVQLMAKRGRIDQTTGPVIDLTPEERSEFRRLRKAKGLGQEQLATKIGVSTGTISNIETGRSGQVRREPYLEAMRYLKSTKEVAAHEDASTRLKRVNEKYLRLDGSGQAAVEALMDALLTAKR
jgi:transcriptional regulator with XRE-family HTH domain